MPIRKIIEKYRGRERRKDPERRMRHDHAQDALIASREAAGGAVTTGIAAIIALSGASGTSGQQSNKAENELNPATITRKAEPTDSPQKPSFTDRVKIERTLAPSPPEKVGVVIDIKAEDLAKYALSFTRDTKSTYVNATPYAKTGKDIERDYYVPQADPFSLYTEVTDAQTIRNSLEQYRQDLRQYKLDVSLDVEKEFKRENKFTIPETKPNGSGFQLAEIPHGSPVILRIDLGSQSSPIYNYITNMLDTTSIHINTLESLLNTGTPFFNFVREAVTNPETKAFDSNAKNGLQRLFALNAEERNAFAKAVRSNDIAQAKSILFFTASKNPISEDIFNALRNYANTAINSGIDATAAENEIYQILGDEHSFVDSIAQEKFNNAPPGSVTQLLGQAVSIKQFKTLSDVDIAEILFLTKYLFNQNNVQTYSEFSKAFGDTLKSPEDSKDHVLPEVLPKHTFAAIKQNLSALIGSGRSDGWLDITDRNNNLLSIMGLHEHLQALKNMQAEIQDSASNLNNILVHRDGKIYLEIALQDGKDVTKKNRTLVKNNNYLAILSNIMLAASDQRPLLGSAASGERPGKAVTDFFASESPDFDGISWQPASISQIFDFLQASPALDMRTREAINSPSTQRNDGKATFTLSEPVHIAEIGVRDLQRPARSTSVDPTTFEVEVQLPASGASAASGR